MHLVIGTSEGICLASPILASKWLVTSLDWPKGLSTGAPSSHRGAFLIDPESVQAVPRMTGFPGAV